MLGEHLLRFLLFCFLMLLIRGHQCESCSSSLHVAAFNVQVFGQSKVNKPEVVEVLLKILGRYDLTLVQEIRDSQETAFPLLIEALNTENNDVYEYVTSQRTGRSSSKEQYGFVYRKDKLEITSMYEREDEYDVFEREPLVVRFRRSSETGRQREFTFIPLHAKPSEAVAEMNNLIDVYEESTRYYGSDSVIAGDLNADCSYVCKTCWNDIKLRTDSRFLWMIPDDADTTVAATDCAYDRIVLAGNDLQVNSCCANVFRFDLEYGLSEEETKDVSDHYPIEFMIY